MKRLVGAAAGICGLASVLGAAPAAAQEPFIGEIRQMPYTFCPQGWASTEGQLMSISANQALFSLLGTNFGGDGRTTFALPDLRGRAPLGQGTGPGLSTRLLGQASGTETVTLTVAEMPTHNHVMTATSSPPDTNAPDGAAFGTFPAGQAIYDDGGGALDHQLRANMISSTGGNQPVPNMQPYLVTRFCIATMGIYPSRN
ncbi:phage tail protein [Marinicauda algicola]|uniref:Phage tail protein n=1 Tax=Marinicauda algicola TaxID=2029849 RepID=A0A4S2GXX0_9PROT|nr:tail fiber protein [Marinicauda algicola]TGY87903.1 phage tail protein [Marinicauda algicola]